MCKKALVLSDRTVPCGQCKQCLKRRAYEWSVRIQQEVKHWDSAHFITLTYNDRNLPIVDDCGKIGTLDKRDVQLFMKRVRKANKSQYQVRYFLVGEYGGETRRPHYHGIFFNLDMNVIANLHNIWSNGHVDIGSVTEKSIRYVTNYMLTKNFDVIEGQIKPFTLMSRRPAIGSCYISDNFNRHFINGQTKMHVAQQDKPFLSRYYVDRLFNEHQRLEWQKQKHEHAEKKYNERMKQAEEADKLDPLGQAQRNADFKELMLQYKLKQKRNKL